MAAPTQKPSQPVNFQALLGSDPVLQTSLGQINTAAAANKDALTAQRQSELVRYGGIPTNVNTSLAGNIAPDVTGTTVQEVQQATQAGLSDLGQAQRAYNTANQSSVANLAARGMLHSGAYREHALQNLTGYQTDLAKAQTGVLGQLAAAWQNYTGQQSTLAGQAQSATNAAAGRLERGIGAGLYGSNPTSTPKPTAPLAPGRFQAAQQTTGYPPIQPPAGSYPRAKIAAVASALSRRPMPVPTATVKPLV